MACSHADAPIVMQRAEEWLRNRGIPESKWAGVRIQHAENTPEGPWKSVVIEIERRNGEWIVTDIDRRDEPLPVEGIRVVSEPRFA